MIPRDEKIDRLQYTAKLAGITRHLIIMAVVKQNCIEALNQHSEPLEKKARVTAETSAIRRPRPLRNETADQLIRLGLVWFE